VHLNVVPAMSNMTSTEAAVKTLCCFHVSRQRRRREIGDGLLRDTRRWLPLLQANQQQNGKSQRRKTNHLNDYCIPSERPQKLQNSTTGRCYLSQTKAKSQKSDNDAVHVHAPGLEKIMIKKNRKNAFFSAVVHCCCIKQFELNCELHVAQN